MESRELPLEPFELSMLPFLLLIALLPPLGKVAPSGAFFRFFIMYATAGGDFQIILTPNCDEFFVFWGEEKMMAEIHSTGPFVCKCVYISRPRTDLFIVVDNTANQSINYLGLLIRDPSVLDLATASS